MSEETNLLLIHKSLTGTLEEPELPEFEAWISESSENQALLEECRATWETAATLGNDYRPDVEAGILRLRQRIAEEERHQTVARSFRISRPTAWVAAASFMLLLSAGIWWMMGNNEPVWQSLATTKGEQKSVQLADGSTVWLNENSQLEYTTDFSGKERNVNLRGEAFFEVAKNPDQPFVVHTRNADVRVLGTSFDVRETKNGAQTLVFVKTGKVRLTPSGDSKGVNLEPSQSGVYDAATKQITHNVSASPNAISWHTGEMLFENTPLDQAVSEIANHYRLDLKILDGSLGDCPFTYTVQKQSAEETLHALERIFGITASKQPDGSYVLSGKCQ